MSPKGTLLQDVSQPPLCKGRWHAVPEGLSGERSTLGIKMHFPHTKNAQPTGWAFPKYIQVTV